MTAARVAYGLGITGLDAVDVLPPVDAGAPPAWVVAVDQTVRPAPPIDPRDGVCHHLPGGRAVVFRRAARTARYHGPPLAADVLAHPFLTVVGVRFNRWLGRECFHAGVFAAAGRSWLVFGPRTAGKSTLLAALASAGWRVMADDLAVTDGHVVFSGPRIVDLREPLPDRRLRVALARSGQRLRVPLGPVAGALPVGGMFFLHWSDEPDPGSGVVGPAGSVADPSAVGPVGGVVARPVPPSELLGRLARIRRLPALPTDPLTLLELAGRPAWDLTRPRNWAALPDTIATLAQTIAGAVRDRSGPEQFRSGGSRVAEPAPRPVEWQR